MSNHQLKDLLYPQEPIVLGNFQGKTDDQLADELRELTKRIYNALKHREDIIEELERREIPALTLRGLRPMIEAVAERLGIEVPPVPDPLPKRERDESCWWTNTASVAILVNLFRWDAIAAASDMEPADAERWRHFAGPQTALMLGSQLDPNDDTVDWKAECDRLADDLRRKV